MRLLEDEATHGPVSDRITLLRSTEAASITRSLDGELCVILRNTQLNSTMAFAPKVLLGCDGMHSVVRSTLQRWASIDAEFPAEEVAAAISYGSGLRHLGRGAPKFDMVAAPSLSTNLRFKVLQLPPNPAMVDGTVLDNPSFSLLAGQKAPLIGEARGLIGVTAVGLLSVHGGIWWSCVECRELEAATSCNRPNQLCMSAHGRSQRATANAD